MSDPDLSANVRRGAALLDLLEPGWHRRVALDRLAMDTCDRCILGQLHGDYVGGYFALSDQLRGKLRFAASDLGFTLTEGLQEDRPDEVDSRFATLADLWRDQVWARSEAGR